VIYPAFLCRLITTDISTDYQAFVGANLFAHNFFSVRMNSPLRPHQLRFLGLLSRGSGQIFYASLISGKVGAYSREVQMKVLPSRILMIAAGLMLAMAATRFNHFGSAFSLPDASWAVFFLGGLYLACNAGASLVVFVLLLLQAGLMDNYVTTVQGVSDWCMTPAYWFLIPTYASLWLAGRWFAVHHAMQGKGFVLLAITAWAANSFAFLFSNATFYLASGRFDQMAVTDFVARVSEYYVSYVSMAMFYIACAVGMQMLFGLLPRKKVQLESAKG
jgi:hypothetical protein